MIIYCYTKKKLHLPLYSTSQNKLNERLKYYSVSPEILEYALCILTTRSVGVQEVV